MCVLFRETLLDCCESMMYVMRAVPCRAGGGYRVVVGGVSGGAMMKFADVVN